ncbi:hypothetical protein RRG08_009869 [Elysia crispata]|uniref:Uncharacterized protein n=1 Tax=Elysia crispata TaxID=231223 RepID=A0AAE1D9N8_9GAST|nr:hypothetical protein RRG08_009869 [Elysia crispata]
MPTDGRRTVPKRATRINMVQGNLTDKARHVQEDNVRNGRQIGKDKVEWQLDSGYQVRPMISDELYLTGYQKGKQGFTRCCIRSSGHGLPESWGRYDSTGPLVPKLNR